MPSKSKTGSKSNKAIELLVRIRTESVFKHTGKHWAEWISLLDRAGGLHWTHKEIAAYLKKKYRLTPWWQLMVAHGYDVYSGKKIEGQNKNGLYSLTATKSCSLPQKKVWKFMTSHEGLCVWLNPMSEFSFRKKSSYEVEGGIFGEIRTLKSPERARLTWVDLEWEKPSILQLYVAKRPGNKSMLVLMHENLVSISLREQMRVHWKSALNSVVQALEEQS